jgi:hypothetical protein
MAENKTKATRVSPAAFVKRLAKPQQQKDSRELIAMMRKSTGEPPKMWGPSIIGFGTTTYRLASGKIGEICTIGFSPRKPSLVLYIGAPLKDKTLMSRLGKYKASGGCLHVKTLDDVDRGVLSRLIATSVRSRRKKLGV